MLTIGSKIGGSEEVVDVVGLLGYRVVLLRASSFRNPPGSNSPLNIKFVLVFVFKSIVGVKGQATAGYEGKLVSRVFKWA